MARSELIHTYMCIGTAILCFVGALLVGINLLTDPEINRGDVYPDSLKSREKFLAFRGSGDSDGA